MTATGINVKGILARLILEKRILSFRNVPAISDEEGRLFTVREIDDMLLEVLKDYYLENRDLFSLYVTSAESLDRFYHCFIKFRKTSATRATNEAVTSTDVDIVNQ